MLEKLKCCATGRGEFERGTALGIVFFVSCVLGLLAPVVVAAVVKT